MQKASEHSVFDHVLTVKLWLLQCISNSCLIKLHMHTWVKSYLDRTILLSVNKPHWHAAETAVRSSVSHTNMVQQVQNELSETQRQNSEVVLNKKLQSIGVQNEQNWALGQNIFSHKLSIHIDWIDLIRSKKIPKRFRRKILQVIKNLNCYVFIICIINLYEIKYDWHSQS